MVASALNLTPSMDELTHGNIEAGGLVFESEKLVCLKNEE